MMHKAWRSIDLLFFEVIHQISRSHVRKNWRFESNLRLLGRSQLSNPSDLPCSRSSIKFQGHTGWKIDNLNHLSKITRPVAAIKSLRFALFKVIHQISRSHQRKKSPYLTRIEHFRTVIYHQISNISHTNYTLMFLVSSCSCLCPSYWCQVFSLEWRCSWMFQLHLRDQQFYCPLRCVLY